ncbi:MAG: ATP-grasp domain-containing protein [Treponema sp.]|nr:ATP-grasp domain-containing protein [Treponema sp.]
MRIVFYSTNSNRFDTERVKITVMPSDTQQFDTFCHKYPEHEFYCVSQSPSLFMGENTILLSTQSDYVEVSQKIIALKPDIAVALSFWIEPYDWLCINDSLVAEELNKNGIKTICNSAKTCLLCFNKRETNSFLTSKGFNSAKYVFADHNLYFCAGSNKDVIHNVYKDSLYKEIEKLELPLIIKDNSGLSSYGMTVVNTYAEAKGYLNSKRNNSDRLIEEYIDGEHFGVEVYGCDDNYTVLPVFFITKNKFGITSPKQSTKHGPVLKADKNKYRINSLNRTINKLCYSLKINGCAQIDLIYSRKKWYIVEINPRLSGMSYLYSSRNNRSVFDMIFESCILHKKIRDCGLYSVDLKLPVLSEEQLSILYNYPEIVLINQWNNKEARQEREKGFCECIIRTENKKQADEFLKKLSSLEFLHDFFKPECP